MYGGLTRKSAEYDLYLRYAANTRRIIRTAGIFVSRSSAPFRLPTTFPQLNRKLTLQNRGSLTCFKESYDTTKRKRFK